MDFDYDINHLYNSILECDILAIKKILNCNKLDINKILPDKEMNILHLAVGLEPDYKNEDNFSEMITELILIHGANPNECNLDGLTPLHIACAWGRLNIVNILLDFGANPAIKDNHKRSPLDYANENGHFDIVTILLDFFKNYYEFYNVQTYSLNLEKIIVEDESLKTEYEIIKSNDNSANSLSFYNVNIDSFKIPSENNSLEILSKKNSGILETYLNDQVQSCVLDFTSDPDIIPAQSLSAKDRSKYDLESKLNTSQNSSLYHTCNEIFNVINIIEESSNYTKSTDDENSSIKVSPLKFTKNEENNVFSVLYQSNDHESSKESLVFENEASSCSPFPHKNYCSKTTLNKEKFLKDKEIKPHTHILSTDNNQIEEVNELQMNIPNYLSESQDILTFNKSLLPDVNNTRSIIEEYKYEDKCAGVVLFEKRLLSTASILNNNIFEKSLQLSRVSSVSSLPLSVDYDVETLRRELVEHGVNPGPITASTKKVYLKKLFNLKKSVITLINPTIMKNRVYTVEIEKSLRDFSWTSNLSLHMELEKKIVQQFEEPDPRKRWREGIIKSSFTYLLLDPRITNGLPNRVDKLDKKDLWKLFLDSIFYVGKGKRSRPYSHLYQAASLYNTGQLTSEDQKIQLILNIWKEGLGVVCLHIFQNIIPAEAYTREASMIEVLGLKNLKNIKPGNYYGVAATWSLKEKKLLGLYLLYRAMLIFLYEGERQLRPVDIQ